MRTLLKPIVTGLLALTLAVAARAQVTPEQETEIRKMIQLTGMERLMEQMKDQMLTALRKGAPPNVPDAFWEKTREKMKVDDLIQQIIPLYAKYYTVEDLRAINAFYASPAGQRLIANLPQVMQESMKIGQAWGMKVGQEVAAEVQAEVQKSAPSAPAPTAGP